MATGQQRETVEFDPNVVQRIALKYQTGRVVAGRNGARVMFTTADDRVFFLDQDVAQMINDLRLKAGAPFTVCRKQAGNATSWEVLKLGEQKDGTFVVQAETARLDAQIQKQKAGADQSASPAAAPAQVSSDSKDSALACALKASVLAAYAAGVYAKSIGYAAMPQFTSEDLRTMANTLMIQEGGR
jgi:hypothetical protein